MTVEGDEFGVIGGLGFEQGVLEGECAILDGVHRWRKVMDAKELLRRYAAGERDFAGVDLREVELRDAELRGINLSGADLSSANLSGADLSGYGYGQGDKLAFSSLNSAILRNTDLSWANLACVDFSEADLTGADLTKANCDGTVFYDAILINVNFTSVKAGVSGFSLEGAEMGYDLDC